MMMSRNAFGRTLPRALRHNCCATSPRSCRGIASTTAPSLQYETAQAAGIKIANREIGAPTTSIALVAKAGSRYEPFPGFSEALVQFAFKSTFKRSALRITRETELLGSDIGSKHSRENIILQTKFLSGDLPYFVELLAEVASQTKFSLHELNELVINLIRFRQQALLISPENLALDGAHGLAFHRGLGNNIIPSSSTPFEQHLSTEALAEFAKAAYTKPNIALVAGGPNSTELSKWVGQFFADLPTSKPKEALPSHYYGGEQHIPSKSGNAIVISFPGSSAFGTPGYKPESAVLAALLGGETSIKWTSGFSLLAKAAENFPRVRISTKNHAYSDAGLFAITVSGRADQVSAASKSTVDAVKRVAAGDVASEDVKKAIALAKFRALEAAQNLETSLEFTGSALINCGKPYQVSEIAQSFDRVTEQQVKGVSSPMPMGTRLLLANQIALQLAKSLLSEKASLVAVGDISQLPFSEDLGLTA
ncbi:Metalloenzyme, LuxS/M16 peptidase-like protein [Elaphomyces granulatus]